MGLSVSAGVDMILYVRAKRITLVRMAYAVPESSEWVTGAPFRDLAGGQVGLIADGPGHIEAMVTHDTEVSDHAGAVHRHDVATVLRFLIAAAFVLALVLVGADNRDKVRIGYVTGHAQAPVWIVVVASALVGIIVSRLLGHRRHN